MKVLWNIALPLLLVVMVIMMLVNIGFDISAAIKRMEPEPLRVIDETTADGELRVQCKFYNAKDF